MSEQKVEAGTCVITQGEEGNFFYVVDTGAFDCFVRDKDHEDPGRLVLQYASHTTFGELALMYNAPRAATVKATADSVLWAMDRHTFRTLLLGRLAKKRVQFEEFVESVPLFKPMNAYERSSLADAFSENNYAAGDTIIAEGDTSDRQFYILSKGEAKGLKGGQQTATYSVHDFFGELVPLQGGARNATVQATTACTAVSIDSASFHRLLVPCKPIIQARASEY